jgi:hypothetical protein
MRLHGPHTGERNAKRKRPLMEPPLEAEMKASLALAIGIVAWAVGPALAAPHRDTAHPRAHYAHRHVRKAPANEAVATSTAQAPSAPTSLPSIPQPGPFQWPRIAPYPPGQGHADGLSRNPDDCNQGCIDY